ncbi:uncharacterized protein GGS22DRAFT_182821 [Annulohypoxylon maeteangense]|uniref:uncharacterized protein n=1 Tax=Annulohypoxylon maeteangense TaxID=1927788 RepID=UPI0020085F7B|nr:uncharacterized protein GGS22DRAFT_182821 [Annulohypoxylon maeteangense]KAI0879774.1 hypothetical protein GGS22DRAFT_182821 [Annulohypoxylon maeteangense]
MNSSRLPPQCSAELPTLGRNARRLVEGLDKHKSLDELFPIVVDMAEELDKQAIPCASTVKMFTEKDSEQYKQLHILFHTLNRDILRSLVLGTLSYDLWDKDSNSWQNTYSTHSFDAAGSYVMTLSIEGRRGKFLNGKEIGQVRELLDTYERCCQAWISHMEEDAYSFNELSDQQKRDLREALLIDNEMLSDKDKWDEEDDYQQPALLRKTGDGSIKARETIGMLRDQLWARMNPHDDATYQCSSPSYVGCSQKMGSRMPSHNPDGRTLASPSALHRILTSCIRHIGLEVSVKIIPILPVWEPGQIQLSEVLLTVLAQSMVTVHGLNAIQPGTSSRATIANVATYNETKELVWVKRTWLAENIRKSLNELLARDIYERVFEPMVSEDEVKEKMEKVSENVPNLRALVRELEELMNEQAYGAKELKERALEAEKFYHRSRGMFPNLPPPSSARNDEHFTDFRQSSI